MTNDSVRRWSTEPGWPRYAEDDPATIEGLYQSWVTSWSPPSETTARPCAGCPPASSSPWISGWAPVRLARAIAELEGVRLLPDAARPRAGPASGVRRASAGERRPERRSGAEAATTLARLGRLRELSRMIVVDVEPH